MFYNSIKENVGLTKKKTHTHYIHTISWWPYWSVWMFWQKSAAADSLNPQTWGHPSLSVLRDKNKSSISTLNTISPFSPIPSFPFVSSLHFQPLPGITAKFLSESSLFYSSQTLLQILSQTVVICACVKAELLLAFFHNKDCCYYLELFL